MLTPEQVAEWKRLADAATPKQRTYLWKLVTQYRKQTCLSQKEAKMAATQAAKLQSEPEALAEWWDQCQEPREMLEAAKGKASQRKLRLFSTACCWQVWNLLTDPRSCIAVKVAERYADGKATRKDAEKARAEMRTEPPIPFETELAWRCGGPIESLTANAGLPRWFSVSTKLSGGQAALLRCIFGNPWRPAKLPHDTACRKCHMTTTENRSKYCEIGGDWQGDGKIPHDWQALPSPWLAWNSGTVPKLAQRIYDERRWEQLPILADALEEAGCIDEQILGHCRGGGLHGRGCWVVDLLLGKE